MMVIKRSDADITAKLVETLQQRLTIPEPETATPVNWGQASYLANLVLNHPTGDRPLRTMEIGLGLGCSAAAILICNRSSHHVVISMDDDPERQKIGLDNAQMFDERPAMEFLDGESHHHLPALASRGELFDLVHIDGNHRFDDAFVDFHYAGRITAPGGIVILDDTWMPSIKSVVAWIETNLSGQWESVTGAPKNSAVFHNTGRPDDRTWQHHVPFRTNWRRSPFILRKIETFLRKKLFSAIPRG